MSRETYETYSAEPEKIDLIAFLAEYFQAFRKFFLGVLILVILMGGGSFLTAKLRYQPMYEAYTSFVVGSNRAVGYSYYDNVTAQQLGKTFPYIVTSGVLKDVVARDLQVGAVTSQIEASVMENTNLFTIRVKDSSPDTAYRVLQSVITNYPEVAEYIIGATTLTVVDDSGVPVSPINSQDAVHAGMIGAAAGLAVALLLVFIYVRTRKTIRQADDVKKLTNAAFLGNLPEAKIKKRSNRGRAWKSRLSCFACDKLCAGRGKDNRCRESRRSIRKEEVPRSAAGRRSAKSVGIEVYRTFRAEGTWNHRSAERTDQPG